MTTVYHFDCETGIYTAQSEARLCPFDGTDRLPGCATFLAPPPVQEGSVAAFTDGAWSEVVDNRGHIYWLADGTRHVIDALGVEPPAEALDAPPPAPREVQFQAALGRIDSAHAGWLELMTGGATVAERDTWKPKEEAARALIADTATPGQTAMLTAEATARGETAAALAALVVAKADAFLGLIGIAGQLRAQGRAAITAATAPEVDLADVEAAITTALQDLANNFAAQAVALGA